MGQKTNPIGLRLGIIRGWDSNWYASKKDYASKLIEDNKIRSYLNARINKGGISKIVIESIIQAAQEMLENHNDIPLQSVGVTIPGLANPCKGIWVESSFSGIKNININILL